MWHASILSNIILLNVIHSFVLYIEPFTKKLFMLSETFSKGGTYDREIEAEGATKEKGNIYLLFWAWKTTELAGMRKFCGSRVLKKLVPGCTSSCNTRKWQAPSQFLSEREKSSLAGASTLWYLCWCTCCTAENIFHEGCPPVKEKHESVFHKLSWGQNAFTAPPPPPRPWEVYPQSSSPCLPNLYRLPAVCFSGGQLLLFLFAVVAVTAHCYPTTSERTNYGESWATDVGPCYNSVEVLMYNCHW